MLCFGTCGMIDGLWWPSVAHFHLNATLMEHNVTLEGMTSPFLGLFYVKFEFL
jgi:hypothetical protein